MFQNFCQQWLTTGGLIFPWAGSWRDNVTSWLDQSELPILVVVTSSSRPALQRASASRVHWPRGDRSAHQHGDRGGKARKYAQTRDGGDKSTRIRHLFPSGFGERLCARLSFRRQVAQRILGQSPYSVRDNWPIGFLARSRNGPVSGRLIRRPAALPNPGDLLPESTK